MTERAIEAEKHVAITPKGNDLVVCVDDWQISFNGQSELAQDVGSEIKESGLDQKIIERLENFREDTPNGAWYGYWQHVVNRAIGQIESLEQDVESDRR